MDELVIEHALDILQRKVSLFLKEKHKLDFKDFEKQLKIFADEEDKIYNLDKETIKKVYEVYLNDIKNKGRI